MVNMDKLSDLRLYLEGKKSYIFGVLTASWNLIDVFGVISPTTEQNIAVNALMIALLGMSVAARVSRKAK